MNQHEVPHVGDVTYQRFEDLFNRDAYFPVTEIEGTFAGFVVLFDQNADYDSPNFLWFKERYERFSYVDRIVVAQEFRRQGLASKLYAACIAQCLRAEQHLLTLEINIKPPNPISAAFHKSYGFQEVGIRQTDNMAKAVSMQILSLNMP